MSDALPENPEVKEPTEAEVELAKIPIGSGSGTQHGYLVQARYMYHGPKDFGGVILDQRWRTLHFQKSPIGVPVRADHEWHLHATRLMNYHAAEALRWWFLASCRSDGWGGTLCVETRIIKCRIEYSFKAKAIEAIEEDRKHGEAGCE